MKFGITSVAGVVLAFLLSICPAAFAAGPSAIELPKPRMDGGKPLMQALKDRMTIRTFAEEKLSMQNISDLLWAAFGISRPDGRRTAPSARNRQETAIYLATADGLFLWDAEKNVLNRISEKDIRAVTGMQPYVKEAPLNLIYVADYSKLEKDPAGDKDLLVGADVGFISENVYLYCASEGLATVVRALIDKQALAKEMGLKPDQKIILAQSVGFPKK